MTLDIFSWNETRMSGIRGSSRKNHLECNSASYYGCSPVVTGGVIHLE